MKDRSADHSMEFLKILRSKKPEPTIRAITHSKPILVFWVSPDSNVIDAKNEHHENPPHGDRSILSDKTYKGHLRGRAAFIGNQIYVVIYGDKKPDLSKRQFALLRRSYPEILNEIERRLQKGNGPLVASAHFINEAGESLVP